MTVFIPALIAVLLAEFGGRVTQFPRLAYLMPAAAVLGLAVGVSAFAGVALGATMNGNARALLLGVALILTGCAQFGKAPSTDPPATILATLIFIWRSSAPFLAFAFALWKAAPVGAAAGALTGVAAAVALGAVPLSPTAVQSMRRAAGATMTLTGLYAALWALRFIG